MTEERKTRYNTAVIRLLPLLDSQHPDSRGTILIHGSTCDTETYIEIARAFDFKFERSETSEEFCRKIESRLHLLLIMIIDDVISQSMRDSLIRACETIHPIYVLHITTKEGDIPNENRRYRVYTHHKDIIPGNDVVANIMEKTLDLLEQANIDQIESSIPDYIKKINDDG